MNVAEKKRKRLEEEKLSLKQKEFKQTKLTDKTNNTPSSSLKEDVEIPGLYLAENFIDQETETKLMKEIDEREWRSDLTRRTQHYGYAYNYSSRNVNNSNNQTSAPPIPEVFKELLKDIQAVASEQIKSLEFKQVIVNEYKGTSQGISKHVDQCIDFGPVILILSLGDDCVMRFHKLERVIEEELVSKSVKRKEVSPSIVVDKLLPRRSLIILSKDARYQFQHEIPKTKTFKVKNTVVKTRTESYRRVSVTFRSLRSTAK
ncbi:hypothetical protein FDP41_003143 [Naegleria fowleri]|uniref:Alpha-ketoglutarate-dependent dioxygenase AlkB-like domain-containing protein n=1 Tax=Naegleria fowleri TaxID=5763 RepID=A0A6A5BTX9_NAEFO|nr:uncharacterized protein FDP41_003143 [Naegleria fowleri]KAF0977821.1 hypothetical protein FDP41_003143 [Naegleria fowleri]